MSQGQGWGPIPDFRERVGNGTHMLLGSLLDPQSLWSRVGWCLRTQGPTRWQPFKAEVLVGLGVSAQVPGGWKGAGRSRSGGGQWQASCRPSSTELGLGPSALTQWGFQKLKGRAQVPRCTGATS